MSSEPMDLLVVADAADATALEIRSYLAEHGRTAVIMDPVTAAQMFTISTSAGATVVEPDVATMLRLPPPPARWESFDAEFQFNECLAQLWAATALMTSPVINRPHPRWLGAAVSPSAVVTAVRAGVPVASTEVFSAQPAPPAGDAGEQWWVQDLPTLTVTAWPDSPGSGPYRSRWSDADPAFEVVVTFLGKSWACTNVDLDHLELVPRSALASEALGLGLAALTWRIGPAGRTAELVHIEPFPGLEQLRMVWLGFGPHLLEVIRR